jgi:hypothetical protein
LLAEHAEDRFLKMPPELRAHVSNYYKGAKVLPAKLAALLMAAPEQ